MPEPCFELHIFTKPISHFRTNASISAREKGGRAIDDTGDSVERRRESEEATESERKSPGVGK